MEKRDNINPSHYTQGDIECIDAIKAAVTNKRPEEAVLVGNIIKYLWRYEEKGGLESIRKAKWYLENLEKEYSLLLTPDDLTQLKTKGQPLEMD